MQRAVKHNRTMRVKKGMSEKNRMDDIGNRIYTIEHVQVMLDEEFAEIYGVENNRRNEQVGRNIAYDPFNGDAKSVLNFSPANSFYNVKIE